MIKKTKKCSNCATVKELQEFALHKHQSDGRAARCLACNRLLLGRDTTALSYRAAKLRCNSRNHRSYYLYGGRGILFKFSSLQELVDNIGERPKGYTLERINTNGHYEVGNVAWATRTEQSRNTRTCCLSKEDALKIKELFKKGLNRKQIAVYFGVNRRVVDRVILGRTWYE